MSTLKLRYFASLREALGPSESFTAEPLPATVAALRATLVERGGAHAQVLAPGRALRCAVNQELVEDDAALADGDEVAFFPPVTGG